MEENKNIIPVSLKNLEEFKGEMDASVDAKVAAATTPTLTFATTAQIKALFAEAPAQGEEGT